MALSNWDTFAINEQGNPCKGDFISPLGVHVKIYKNWIYVSDEISWQADGGYIKPTVMQIFKSELRYKDVHVVSAFIDNSIYLAVWSGYKHDNTLKTMVGCGVYGYDNGEYVGVTDDHLHTLTSFLNSEQNYFSILHLLREIDLKNGKRFSQGDMFFHDEIGTDSQCSCIGEADEPILSKILKED